MNLQAKLTLGAVVLEVMIVGAISAVSVENFSRQAFSNVLTNADLVATSASSYVSQALNANPKLEVQEALRDPSLFRLLGKIMSEDRELIEIAVVDPHRLVVADSNPERVGTFLSRYPDFEALVKAQGWSGKLALLSSSETGPYQLERPLGPVGGVPIVFVRVLVNPALIRHNLGADLADNAKVALGSFAAAVALTFLVSALAFRRVGQLSRMLDLVASGEYQPVDGSARGPADEFSAIESKVSLLSQRLRGAESEVTSLRGNVDRLLQDLEDAVFIFNRERRLVFASASVEKILGAGRAGLVGQTLESLFPPSAVLGELIAQAASSGLRLRNRRVPLTAPDAPPDAPPLRTLLLSLDMLESSPGVPTGGFMARLRDPEAQRKLGRELQTADRLAAISRITGGVAHEVKNPLNAMLLHLEVAKAKLIRGDTEIAPQMEIISNEILRLDRVVKTFLDFNRPVELTRTLIPAQDLVNEIVELARPQADAAHIQITVEEQAEGVEIRVDRDLLKQALLNLAVNAIQAMPEGGELRFQSVAVGDSLEIRIADSGSGIPPELREKIFRLYFTTKLGGSGIGLAMTFRIVQLHDGTIDFTSEPGKGTTFVIRLPIAI